MPFVVDVDGQSTITVLGTSFNVNSYHNEGNIKATLIEGSIRIIKENKKATMTHGQQAVVLTSDLNVPGASEITVTSNADIEKALAWKNGLFNFNGSDLPSVMRQLERWYDINVRYESMAPNVKFKGEMSSGVKLS